jgi:mono/diheme cytochrome c family protein
MRTSLLILALFCSSGAVFGHGEPAAEAQGTGAVTRWYKAEMLPTGRALYVGYCAGCHGARLEGVEGWQRPGSHLPPPLDASGHAWGHSLQDLAHVTREGSKSGDMPAFKHRLRGEDDLLAILAWIQAQWPDSVYRKWQEVDRTGGHHH